MIITLYENSFYSFNINAANGSIICLRIQGLNEEVKVYQLTLENLNCIQSQNGNRWNQAFVKELSFFPENNYYGSYFVIENNMNYILIVNRGQGCQLICDFSENPSLFYNAANTSSSVSGML